ncbi:unnamed protein product [Sphagnum jensenii]|uniref:Uncharacterized protein n=1 Tax=Sphagnum jensenii TaxID=128206 RepID=A0ABP1A1B4_9BRYO
MNYLYFHQELLELKQHLRNGQPLDTFQATWITQNAPLHSILEEVKRFRETKYKRHERFEYGIYAGTIDWTTPTETIMRQAYRRKTGMEYGSDDQNAQNAQESSMDISRANEEP